jgi:hypothetical protein
VSSAQRCLCQLAAALFGAAVIAGSMKLAVLGGIITVLCLVTAAAEPSTRQKQRSAHRRGSK